ncbi:MAG: hypothetical protein IJH11_00950 [Lachnospiraceae bacterium]|nr:hypothetical protein [Lachnospiraceae bacterium]
MRDKSSAEDVLYIVVTVVLTILILGSFMMMLLTDEQGIPRITFFGFGILFNILLAVNNLTRGRKRGYICLAAAFICAVMAVVSFTML